jgi:DNA-binding LytR/AlgR family response regulator
MNKVNILVVEDEVIIADNICDCLTDLGYNALEPCLDYEEAIKLFEEETVHLAILDINLGEGKSGIELAKFINRNVRIPFIFLTANHDVETVSLAKQVEPYAYLAKPFNNRELYASIELALHNYSKQHERLISPDQLIINDSLFIKEDRVYTRLSFKEILYLRSEHVYTEIVTNERRIVVRSSLNSLLPKLGRQFFRCHRSYIINLQYLNGVNHNNLFVNNNEIPLGKNQREELLSKLQKV